MEQSSISLVAFYRFRACSVTKGRTLSKEKECANGLALLQQIAKEVGGKFRFVDSSDSVAKHGKSGVEWDTGIHVFFPTRKAFRQYLEDLRHNQAQATIAAAAEKSMSVFCPGWWSPGIEKSDKTLPKHGTPYIAPDRSGPI